MNFRRYYAQRFSVSYFMEYWRLVSFKIFKALICEHCSRLRSFNTTAVVNINMMPKVSLANFEAKRHEDSHMKTG